MREQHPESSVVNTSTTITAANDNGSSGSNSSKTEKNTSATTGTSTSTTSNVNIEEADKADTNDDDDSHSSYDAADMHNYFTRIDEGDDEEDKKGADDTSSNGGDDDDDEKNKSDTNADSDSHDLNHIKHKIGYKETKDVLILRLISFSVLLLSTCLVAFCVNYYVRSNEYAKFKYQFKQNTHKVLESLNKKVDDTFASIDIFSSNIVAYVASTNQTWPYITIPNFPILAAKTRSISLGIFLETANLVAPDQRMDWEDFAWEHRQWVNESLIVQQTDENYYGPCIWNTTADPSIYGDFGPIPYTEKYVPNTCLCISFFGTVYVTNE